MMVVCSYCQTELPDKEPLDDPAITHTICPACFDHYTPQWDGQPMAEFLDRFDSPVVAVSNEARILAVNSAAAEAYGIAQREAQGLLGGELLECSYARQPEGCGHTVHCKACTLRNTVTETLSTGRDMHRVPASMTGLEHTPVLLVSTQLRNGVVFVHIEPAEAD